MASTSRTAIGPRRDAEASDAAKVEQHGQRVVKQGKHTTSSTVCIEVGSDSGILSEVVMDVESGVTIAAMLLRGSSMASSSPAIVSWRARSSWRYIHRETSPWCCAGPCTNQMSFRVVRVKQAFG